MTTRVSPCLRIGSAEDWRRNELPGDGILAHYLINSVQIPDTNNLTRKDHSQVTTKEAQDEESQSAPKFKPLKKCKYCKCDALWTVSYSRAIPLMVNPLKIRDFVCDDHLAQACARASSKLRVWPRFLPGPGGTRILPNGLVSTIGGATPSAT